MRVFTDALQLISHLDGLGHIVSAESGALFELDHALQCAALLAQTNPADVELQVAGLIHDLAHPWDGPGQPRHASMGAAAVRGLLGKRMAALIAGHVPAKRYLVATRPQYAALLSEDSSMTLAAQGGAMSAAEIAAFEGLADWQAMLALRVADDSAKVPGAVVPGLQHWLPAIRSLV